MRLQVEWVPVAMMVFAQFVEAVWHDHFGKTIVYSIAFIVSFYLAVPTQKEDRSLTKEQTDEVLRQLAVQRDALDRMSR